MSQSVLSYDFFTEEVLDCIEDELKKRMKDIVIEEKSVIPVLKNNEVIKDALRIMLEGYPYSPVLYLDRYYEEFRIHGDLNHSVSMMAEDFICGLCQDDLVLQEDLRYFESVKDMIFIRLVSGDKNKNIVKSCPYRKFCDLFMTYRILAAESEAGTATILVTNTMIENWGISEEELFKIARRNSRRLYPPRIYNMAETIVGERNDLWEKGLPEELIPKGLSICTNTSGLNGASVICYTDVAAQFAKKIHSGFYILPSSIHEVLFLPDYGNYEPEELVGIVREVNRQVVSEEEILSDNVYYYCPGKGIFQKYTGQISGKLLK